MFDILSPFYFWILAFHIMSVIAWMAGLFYLPRLFVYHTEQVDPDTTTDALFQTMELKLFRLIMNPSMISTYVFGLLLVMTPAVVDWASFWPYTKLVGIAGMTWFHHWCGKRRKDFIAGANTRSGRDYRMMNEVPTLLMALIVISVIVKPF
ncbi:protoporphyrinogen oxidase HemJ [Meridianimarinicoccus aquatilis]|uniref:Protoporphyrinogen IX oxidase n=1 Tax=Meridianimarinicoccus aquatilis TaxID=2552766 RepID=A0A4V3BC32_9RHOB|nr:protoporphyrinogen oxidase HemJ [Fluviibacterium aquatile]QIE41007.1 protoporphyrinogen oxidase HemJ [Rhodobacteraceae bacterium SC52]TDL89309.1 protoporphyrinogen oxidase HemJ [Fluviibacterium aquatile]